MWRWIKKIGKAVTVAGRIEHAVKEWKDVGRKSSELRVKYANLAGIPDDVKDLLREVDEAGKATADIW